MIAMQQIITEELRKIEKRENVRILLAVESGSRAWGFASPDSDYDVRFIYVRPQNEYLRLDPHRDVIELPIDDVLDINGWDLYKTLQLLHKSNPTLFEWFSSPIVYLETDFAERFRGIMNSYFSTKRGLLHYLSMAERNYRDYLCGDMVRAKKYFYALRPILACRWILAEGTPPPVLFASLADSQFDPALRPELDRLLDLKMNSPEIREIPRVNTINDYLDQSIEEIRGRIERLPEEPTPEWSELNALFLDTIQSK